MKKLISILISFILIGLIIGILFLNRDKIIQAVKTYLTPIEDVSLGETNEYYRNLDFDFVQNTNYFLPDNYQDILNIYYTALNAGKEEFTFYCPVAYESCLDDIKKLANDQNTLSDINNYVHPFNSFSHIETEYDNLGKVTIKISHAYSEDKITKIKEKVDQLYNELVDDNNSLYKNIQTIHDYIINNSKYDTIRSEQGDSEYQSEIAYGPLFEGYAICGGYTDLMELFLEKLNVKSFKVSSEKHVWNAVYYNYTWLNLDLTWDDPVASDGNDYLEYNYFLIDTNELLNQETTEHNFNEEHYYEIKRA